MVLYDTECKPCIKSATIHKNIILGMFLYRKLRPQDTCPWFTQDLYLNGRILRKKAPLKKGLGLQKVGCKYIRYDEL